MASTRRRSIPQEADTGSARARFGDASDRLALVLFGIERRNDPAAFKHVEICAPIYVRLALNLAGSAAHRAALITALQALDGHDGASN